MGDVMNDVYVDAFQGEIELVANANANAEVDAGGLEGNGEEGASGDAAAPDNCEIVELSRDEEEERGNNDEPNHEATCYMPVTVMHNTQRKWPNHGFELNGPLSQVFIAQILENGIYEQLFAEIDAAADELRLYSNPIAPHQLHHGMDVLALNGDRFGRAEIISVQPRRAVCDFVDVGCQKTVAVDDIYVMPGELRILRDRVLCVWVDGAVRKDQKMFIEVIGFEEGFPIAKQLRPRRRGY